MLICVKLTFTFRVKFVNDGGIYVFSRGVFGKENSGLKHEWVGDRMVYVGAMVWWTFLAGGRGKSGTYVRAGDVCWGEDVHWNEDLYWGEGVY